MSPPRKKQPWASNIAGLVISGMCWNFSAPGSTVHSMFLGVLILDFGWLVIMAVEAFHHQVRITVGITRYNHPGGVRAVFRPPAVTARAEQELVSALPRNSLRP